MQSSARWQPTAGEFVKRPRPDSARATERRAEVALLGTGVRVVWQRNVVPSFDVTTRAASAFCLPPNEALRLQPGPGSSVDAEFIDYVTDYAGAGSGPLVCHVRGNAPDLNEALRVLGNIGGTNLPSLSLVANAAMLPPSSIVAYEAHDGGSYLAIGGVDPQPIQTARRTISPALSSAFVSAVDSHPDAHRLRLAITNYTESLTRLHPDVGVAAGLHLYIAVENLTDVIAHRIQRERGLAGWSELGAELGLRPRAGADFVRDGEIRGRLRRECIFDSNTEAHRKMKRLSDGVEHGFIDFAEAREIAAEWFLPAAAQVRRSIFRESGLDAASTTELLTGVYERPLALWSVKAVAMGILRAPSGAFDNPLDLHVAGCMEDQTFSPEEHLTRSSLRLEVRTGGGVDHESTGLHVAAPGSLEPTDPSVGPEA